MGQQVRGNHTWKPIPGFNGYFVNEYGEVYSEKSHKLLKPYISHSGYAQYGLMKDGAQRTCRASRLVAAAFIPNPNNYPQVNHKDENKLNNNVDNLEWCTAKYNSNYGTRTLRVANANRGRAISEETREKIKVARSKQDMSFLNKPVWMCDKDTHKKIRWFRSIKSASEYIGKPQLNKMACRVLRHGAKSSCGYWWCYA